MPVLACAVSLLPSFAPAQVTEADYERAANVGRKYRGLATDIVETVRGIEGTNRFWYRKSVAGGSRFVLVDPASPEKRPAFDHDRLAASLSEATGESYAAVTLPFSSIELGRDGGSIRFDAAGFSWTCSLDDYTCERGGPAAPRRRGRSGRRGRRNGAPDGVEHGDVRDASSASAFELESRDVHDDVLDGMVVAEASRSARSPRDPQDPQGRPPGTADDSSRTSPDRATEVYIENYNVHLRPARGVSRGDRGAGASAGRLDRRGGGTFGQRGGGGGTARGRPLSHDGSEGDHYTLRSIAWSPDSKRLVAYRVRPGYRREVHYVESSPRDQLQPKHSTRVYAKPGDALDVAQPVLFDVENGTRVVVDDALFPNPYSLSNPVWRDDGRAFTFEYNQRGHQVYRVIEVDAQTGRARALVAEESATFINYRPLRDNPRDTGKKVRHELDDGREIIWMSERDGWAHLYLYDGVTGELKNQITEGEWVVRAVERVDEDARQIWFVASGMNEGQDPYFRHCYRIDFDGSNLTALTDADGDHTVTFSDDGEYYVDRWSRVDLAPVAQLRRTSDQAVLLDLETGKLDALLAAGWRPPEVFHTAGRDGETEIWGILHRPSDFDPVNEYPVVESIYAGPQGSFVPKTFRVATQALCELGFIVAQIDGMGTNNRSKAFHDVAWQNLGDAGLPDRILWHRAVAAKYPHYDISRVGIFGTSAGGQSALGALLFHPEFYDCAVANCGCHDNRMDKIWWNEQWMGWPLGPHYAKSSNVENAHRLQGDVLLIVGEMDTNVDPASTLQVVDRLIRAEKDFELLFVPGGGHGAGGAYGRRRLQDFFVRHLMGQATPDWNAGELGAADAADTDGRR